MAWFKVDDGFYTSHKVLQIPRNFRNDAVGSWLMLGVWSADKMTDGKVPAYIVDDFGVSDEALEWLVTVGLWKRTDDGIEFHDWCEYQPTREQLQAKHEARVAAGSKGGMRSGEVRRSKTEANAKQSVSKTEANANPEPEPEPEPLVTKVTNQRATRLPETWNIGTELYSWTQAEAPSLNMAREVAKFRDYWLSVPGQKGTKTDWDRTWKNWVRNNVERNPSLAVVSQQPTKRKITGYDD